MLSNVPYNTAWNRPIAKVNLIRLGCVAIKLGNVGKLGTLSRFAANYCKTIKQLYNHKTIRFPYIAIIKYVSKTHIFKYFYSTKMCANIQSVTL